MHYYEHHIGDFAAATAHLTFIEDAAYSRLLRIYYRDEKPLPTDIKAVQRLAGARSRDEKQAVAVVIDEFFRLSADGYRQKRADDVIARFREKQDAATVATIREYIADNERKEAERSLRWINRCLAMLSEGEDNA